MNSINILDYTVTTNDTKIKHISTKSFDFNNTLTCDDVLINNDPLLSVKAHLLEVDHIGPTGPQGQIGPTGPQGHTGPQGPLGGIVDFIRLGKTSLTENVNVTKVSATTILWDSPIIGPSLYSYGTSSTDGKITVGENGIYLINSTISTQQLGSDRITVMGGIYKNGSLLSTTISSNYSRGSTFGNAVITISTQLELNSSDYIQIRCWADDSDSSVDQCTTISSECELVVSRISHGVPSSSVNVVDNNNGTITIGSTVIDICNLVTSYCINATAVDVNAGELKTIYSTPVDASIGDIKCNFGSTTTWEVVSSTNISSITPTTSNDGKFNIIITSPQSWSLIYNIKCDNIIKDTAQIFGTAITAAPIGTTKILDVPLDSKNTHFNNSTYDNLFDGNTTSVTTGDDQRLHQGGFIYVASSVEIPAGTSVEVYWSNFEDPSIVGIIIEVGTWDSINEVGTITELLYTHIPNGTANVNPTQVFPTVNYDYVKVSSLAENDGDDPVIYEITIGNIPNI